MVTQIAKLHPLLMTLCTCVLLCRPILCLLLSQLCSYVFQDYKRASVVMDRYTDKTFGV